MPRNARRKGQTKAQVFNEAQPKALELAGGDASRLVLIGTQTAIVANSPEHARKLRRQVSRWSK